MQATNSTMRFKPINLGRRIVWTAFALVLLIAPMIFNKGASLSILCQMGTLMIFALSYNMLLGQGGMLSFGHAVYSGLGAYFAIHAMNLASGGSLPIPVSLIPLVGGFAGMMFGILFGYVTTKKAGTTFAMITLGIVELVFACSLMFPGFFGGEGGITTNRVIGQPFLGITYGPAIQVYYLIVAWTLACMAAMFAWTQTPLGRMANAVRDNPERAEFVGYDTHVVRFLTLLISSFFAGIAGGLNCINYEIVTAENVGALRSAGVLMATFVGGAGFFFGPVIGSIVFFIMVTAVGAITKAWAFYLGLLFLLIVLYAPGGFASLIVMHIPVMKERLMNRLWLPYAGALATGLLLLIGLVSVVEITYHYSLEADTAPEMTLFGFQFNVTHATPWAAAVGLLLGGFIVSLFAWKDVGQAWAG
ncbi:branched-chain amino acid ABC transporter permease, partial [Lacisediminimonas sp.]|uniref:branched-chain amino acid ABC transporter permease n=1 Tax=Lacisediminimonas sp. TaxID=3060582 RepID=UPI002720465F